MNVEYLEVILRKLKDYYPLGPYHKIFWMLLLQNGYKFVKRIVGKSFANVEYLEVILRELKGPPGPYVLNMFAVTSK